MDAIERIVEIGLSNAVGAILLATLALAASHLLRRPAMTHALWVLVLLKLLTPPLVPLHLGLSTHASPHQHAPTAHNPSPPFQGGAGGVRIQAVTPTASSLPSWIDTHTHASLRTPQTDDLDPSFTADDRPLPETTTTAPAHHATSAPIRSPTINWQRAVLVIWCFGSLVLLARLYRQTRRMRRLLAMTDPAPEALDQMVHGLATAAGLRRSPTVYLVRQRVSPMIWAIGRRPVLLLPRALLMQLTPAQQEALIAHEIAHLRRRDHWVRWVQVAATILYWWHPVVWLARRQIERAEEHCCDAWVIERCPDRQRGYARAVLDTVDFLAGTSEEVPALANGLARERFLQERLEAMMNRKFCSRMSWTSRFGVALIAAATLPVFAQTGESIPEKGPKVPASQPLPVAADSPSSTRPPTPAHESNQSPDLEERLDKLERLVADLVEQLKQPKRSAAPVNRQTPADVEAVFKISSDGGSTQHLLMPLNSARVLELPGKIKRTRDITGLVEIMTMDAPNRVMLVARQAGNTTVLFVDENNAHHSLHVRVAGRRSSRRRAIGRNQPIATATTARPTQTAEDPKMVVLSLAIVQDTSGSFHEFHGLHGEEAGSMVAGREVVDGILRIVRKNGLCKITAEPVLVTVDGHSAKFATSDLECEFTPTVIGRQRVRVEGVLGLNVDGQVRRLSTAMELRSSETVLIQFPQMEGGGGSEDAIYVAVTSEIVASLKEAKMRTRRRR